MSTILEEPIIVRRLKTKPVRKIITIDLSGVPMRKRIATMRNWEQFFRRLNEVNAS